MASQDYVRTMASTITPHFSSTLTALGSKPIATLGRMKRWREGGSTKVKGRPAQRFHPDAPNQLTNQCWEWGKSSASCTQSEADSEEAGGCGRPQDSVDIRSRAEGFPNRTMICDLHQSLPLLRIECVFEADGAIEQIPRVG
jgi:hypothetical protein